MKRGWAGGGMRERARNGRASGAAEEECGRGSCDLRSAGAPGEPGESEPEPFTFTFTSTFEHPKRRAMLARAALRTAARCARYQVPRQAVAVRWMSSGENDAKPPLGYVLVLL